MNRLASFAIPAGLGPDYPFGLPPFRDGLRLTFDAPVTVLLGENGCGKSTLVELIAAKAGLVRVAADDAVVGRRQALFRAAAKKVDATFAPVRPKGLHFAASDFATYLERLDAEKEFARGELDRVRTDYATRSDYARMMAAVPASRTLAEIDGMYGRDLAMSSHGESYLAFFASRLRPETLVILDEPETPLSFENQLTLLVMIDDAVAKGCQFVIATHSPVLAGIPEATLLAFQGARVDRVRYEDVTTFQLLRRFLADREGFFRNLRKS